MADAVYSRSTAAFGCTDVLVQPVGGNGYVATGCGLTQSYSCMRRAQGFHFDVTCVPDGPAAPVASAIVVPPPPSSALTADDTSAARAAAASCHVSAGALDLRLSATGAVLQAALSPGGEADVAQCLAAALRATSFASSASPRVGVVALGDASATPPTGAPAEATARAIVERERALIFACTSAAAVAVVARWTAEGSVSLSLGDASAGTPEDGCVRAIAIAEAITPPPGVAGSVLHAVRR